MSLTIERALDRWLEILERTDGRDDWAERATRHWIDEMREEHGMSEHNARALLNKLVDDGAALRDVEGRNPN